MILEEHKKAGVCYALTVHGIELPVIDVTHPAFQVAISESELAARTERAAREVEAHKKMPAWLHKVLFRLMFRKSLLGKGMMRAQGRVLDGMTTYLLKLGLDNIGQGYAQPIDREILETVPCLSSRMRLQATARLLADAVIPVLQASPAGRPLHMVNIAGGPAMDSLNALILIRKEQPELLVGRKTVINILDPDTEGPAFAERALSALQESGGPLFGRDVRVRRVDYDWADPTGLAAVLEEAKAEAAAVAGSSEGGLFEYGSDEAIAANLEIFGEAAPADACMIGTVARADGLAKVLNQALGAAVRLRGLEPFKALAEAAGWSVAQANVSPLCHNVCLKKKA